MAAGRQRGGSGAPNRQGRQEGRPSAPSPCSLRTHTTRECPPARPTAALLQAASPNPDAATTAYYLHATPVAAGGSTRRLAEGSGVIVTELSPREGSGSPGSPFTKTVYLPGAGSWL